MVCVSKILGFGWCLAAYGVAGTPTAAPTTSPTSSPTSAPGPTPAPTTVTALTVAASSGDTTITVADLTGCDTDNTVSVGLIPADQSIPISSCSASSSAGDVTLGRALTFNHAVNTPVTFNSPTPTASTPVCFSYESTVQTVSAGKPATLAALRAGEELRLNLDGSFVADKVLGFLHDVEGAAAMFSIEHEAGELRVSANHILLLAGGEEKAAQEVAAGDALRFGGRASSTVLGVRRDATAQGMRSPLTQSGLVAVDNVVASSYASVTGLPVPHASIHAAFFAVRALEPLLAASDIRLEGPLAGALRSVMYSSAISS
eukprot:TRINITY_DN7263_c0_g1_i1.p1 TRINITY_DN7263_c0_g1~~TRINITY_DN7263_c0_g1_i1.p1  ORF type:complete len:317 (-),score=58.83 TRINITY_DN7263_c0_g1_i1:311-1261(-)